MDLFEDCTAFDPFVYGLYDYRSKRILVMCRSSVSCRAFMKDVMYDDSSAKESDFGILKYYLYD